MFDLRISISVSVTPINLPHYSLSVSPALASTGGPTSNVVGHVEVINVNKQLILHSGYFFADPSEQWNLLQLQKTKQVFILVV